MEMKTMTRELLAVYKKIFTQSYNIFGSPTDIHDLLGFS